METVFASLSFLALTLAWAIAPARTATASQTQGVSAGLEHRTAA